MQQTHYSQRDQVTGYVILCLVFGLVLLALVNTGFMYLPVAVFVYFSSALRGRLWVQAAVMAAVMVSLAALRQAPWTAALAMYALFLAARLGEAAYMRRCRPLRDP